jgi:4-coumarate--CoA ligase
LLQTGQPVKRQFLLLHITASVLMPVLKARNVILVWLQAILRRLQCFTLRLPLRPLGTSSNTNHGKFHLSEVDGGPLLSQPSVFRHLELGLRKNPHGLAVICMHQQADHLRDFVPADGLIELPKGLQQPDCLAWTYTQLHEASMRVAAGMHANGARQNSTVLMIIPNGAEYTLLLWTCILMRLTFASVDPGMLDESARAELEHTLDTLKPSIVIAPDAVGAKAVDIALANLPFARPLGITLNGRFRGWKTLAQLAADASESSLDKDSLLHAARNDDPDRVNSIMFTSGTSGRPKACPQSVGGMAHVLESQAWLINADNCALALQQAHNSRGIAPAQALQTWRAGGAVVMSGQGFSVEDAVSAISQYGVTFLVLTPAMVHGLAQRLATTPISVDCVHSIQVGGDVVTKDTLSKCAALFPSARICVNHGMTEGGGAFTWPFFDTPICDIPYFGEMCPVGKVAAGATVRIWDSDTSAASPRDQAGELHICCGSLIPGYLGGRSASSFYEDPKGKWFITGDMAMMTTEGLVYILGRKKDMIKRGGIAVMPAAIENCIEKFTGEQVSIILKPQILSLG